MLRRGSAEQGKDARSRRTLIHADQRPSLKQHLVLPLGHYDYPLQMSREHILGTNLEDARSWVANRRSVHSLPSVPLEHLDPLR